MMDKMKENNQNANTIRFPLLGKEIERHFVRIKQHYLSAMDYVNIFFFWNYSNT